MATVFLANDPRFQRHVAVKVLPGQFLHDPQFRARFEREAQTIATLEHPAIVPVYDFGEDNGQPYIVMRHMSGGSLAEKIEAGKLPLADAISIVKRIAGALDSAHQRNIVHRDLKPGNILFDQYNNAYLSDFGIVKLSGNSANFTGNAIIGTPAYMSPEQSQSKTVDGRTDVYALGIILYEMLTGSAPYGGDTPVSQLMQHILEPIPRIRAKDASLPPAIEDVISMALAKEPNERFASTMALATALDHLGDGEFRPNEATSNPNTLIGGTLIEGMPGATMAEPQGTLMDQGAVVGGTVAETGRIAQRPESIAYTPITSGTGIKKKKSRGLLWGLIGLLTIAGAGAGVYFGTDLIRGSTATPTVPVIAVIDTATPVQEAAVIPPTETLLPTDTPEPDPDEPTITPEPEIDAPILVSDGAIGGGGDRIAYQSLTADGAWNIFTVDLDGKNRQQLTDDGSINKRPHWSPDGTQIAFRSDRSGSQDIWIMNADGSDQRPLISLPDDQNTGAWSPDGATFAYHGDAGTGVASIYMFDLATEQTTRLTTDEQMDSYWPQFSPDGSQLVFWTLRNNGKAEIYLMDIDGSNQRPLVTGEHTYLDPIWSPVDANQIAFYETGARGTHIFIVSPNGGDPVQIDTDIPSNNVLSGWSPDGEWLIFHTNFHGVNELYRVRTDGTESTRLTDSPTSDEHPVWQPNGSAKTLIPLVEAVPTAEPTSSIQVNASLTGDFELWHSFAGDEQSTIEAGATAFELLYPNVNLIVRKLDSAEAKQTYLDAAENGAAPDLYLGPIDWGGEFVDAGVVSDPLVLLGTEALQNISRSALSNARYDGQLVGLPYVAKGISLFRNTTIFPFPVGSLDELFTLERDLINLERGLYYSGASLLAQGGQLMDADGNPAFNSEIGVDWVEEMANFNDPDSYGNQDLEAFERGEVGFVLDATWNTGRLAAAIGSENLAIDPWPAGLSGWVLYDVAYVSAEIDEATKPIVSAFLGHIISAEIQTSLADNGRIPVTDNATIRNPLIQQAATMLTGSQPLPIAPEMAFYWEPLTVAINSVLDDNVDAADALENAERVIQSQLP